MTTERRTCPTCTKDVAVQKSGELRKHKCEAPPLTRVVERRLPRVLEDMVWMDAQRPRSVQTTVGVSALLGCARQVAEVIAGTPETNRDTDKLAAIIGTAVHAAAEAATRARDPFAEVELEVTIPEYDLTGHVDKWDAIDRCVEDWKTKKDLSPDHKPTRQQRAQVQVYAYALALKGYPVEKVRLVFIPRDGKAADAVVWEQPYDESEALTALLWLDGIREQVSKDIKPAPERVASSFCKDWCRFYDPQGVGSGCVGLQDRPVDLVITDPDAIEAAREYADGQALANRADELKNAAKPRLEGLAGLAGSLVVGWSNPKPRLVLDEDAVRTQYAAAGLPLPVREETANPRISVKPAPATPTDSEGARL